MYLCALHHKNNVNFDRSWSRFDVNCDELHNKQVWRVYWWTFILWSMSGIEEEIHCTHSSMVWTPTTSCHVSCQWAYLNKPAVYSGSICLKHTIFCTSLLKAKIFIETLSQLCWYISFSISMHDFQDKVINVCRVNQSINIWWATASFSVTNTFILKQRSCDLMNIGSRLPEF